MPTATSSAKKLKFINRYTQVQDLTLALRFGAKLELRVYLDKSKVLELRVIHRRIVSRYQVNLYTILT